MQPILHNQQNIPYIMLVNSSLTLNQLITNSAVNWAEEKPIQVVISNDLITLSDNE